jgi:hypothetical protein
MEGHHEQLTIGELSRRAYKQAISNIYDAGACGIDLVRTLRDAGLSVESTKKVLTRQLAPEDALRLQLASLELHVASLQRVAIAPHATLRAHPNEDGLKRICAVSRPSNQERIAMIERFFDRLSEGIPIYETLKRQTVEAATPKLPDDPMPAQLDAWIALAVKIKRSAPASQGRNGRQPVIRMGCLRPADVQSAACLAWCMNSDAGHSEDFAASRQNGARSDAPRRPTKS